MKMKVLTLGVFMLVATFGFAQHFEAKLNPIGLIFGSIPVSAEYVINDNMGIEATLAYSFSKGDYYDNTSKASGIVVAGLYKYYFKPQDGGDGFYAFPYIRYASRKFTFNDATYGDVTSTYKAFGAGFGLGYKWVATSGLLVDLGAGVGKNFSGEFTYDDPNYTETTSITIPINGIFRVSVGYRF
ncbi:MAG: DUF3575 domain-containing protein [Bacteroidales bacterium]|nr:DUF3575 domain-containing protein [Bacteroidales bacterium]